MLAYERYLPSVHPNRRSRSPLSNEQMSRHIRDSGAYSRPGQQAQGGTHALMAAMPASECEWVQWKVILSLRTRWASTLRLTVEGATTSHVYLGILRIKNGKRSEQRDGKR